MFEKKMEFSKSYVVMVIVFFINFFHGGFCFTTFVFGDSLVDAGNNDYIFTLSKADSPPYGIDFKPSGGQPTGRFTNGRTISDIIGNASLQTIQYIYQTVITLIYNYI